VEREKRAILSAAAVTAPSQDILDKTRAYYGVPLSDAKVIPNPIQLAGEQWHLSQANPKRIVFIGRFDRLKGGDLIIDAFARVLERIPEAKLWFIGPDRGCVASDGRTWHLEEYVSHRLPGAIESKQVEWLGPQPATALAQFRREALVSVICSLYENFPYTVIEAMALGCPVVAARVGGIPEILREKSNGLLHEPSSPEDLALKLIMLMQNPTWAAQLGQQAAIDCKLQCEPRLIADRSIEFYRSVIHKRKRRKSLDRGRLLTAN
jgi:glycosyltransferase involved in cell wall biosynthesis